jgi:hypothetical protein
VNIICGCTDRCFRVKTSHSLQQLGYNIRMKLQVFQKELRHVWRDIFKRRRPVLDRLLRNNLSLPAGGNQALNYQIMQTPVVIKFPLKFALLRGTICVGLHSVLTNFRGSKFNATSVLHIPRKTNTAFLDLIFISQEYIYRY